MPLLLLLHASQVAGCTQIIRGKGQNFLCFQEAVMQAVHVLNTVTVPMGLQCPGLYNCHITRKYSGWVLMIFPVQQSCFFFSLFISGRMVGKANHCFTTSMGYTFCSMCLHRQKGTEVKLSAFRNTDMEPSWLWWVKIVLPNLRRSIITIICRGHVVALLCNFKFIIGSWHKMT